MFGIGTPELVIICIVALIVLGPKRLPEVARGIGKALADLRNATSGVTEELRNARVMLEEEARAVSNSVKEPLTRPAPPNVVAKSEPRVELKDDAGKNEAAADPPLPPASDRDA